MDCSDVAHVHDFNCITVHMNFMLAINELFSSVAYYAFSSVAYYAYSSSTACLGIGFVLSRIYCPYFEFGCIWTGCVPQGSRHKSLRQIPPSDHHSDAFLNRPECFPLHSLILGFQVLPVFSWKHR